MRRRIESGFTLIELIVVIIILGILAVTALPKYANLEEKALNATNIGIASSLQSAMHGANMAWILYGNNGAIANMPNYLDNSFNFNSSGHPTEAGDNATPGHPVIGPVNANTCGRLWNALMSHSILLDVSGIGKPNVWYFAISEGDYRVSAVAGGLCDYTMMEDANRSIHYDSATGIVTAL